MTSSSQDSGYVDNWQAGKTVIECNLHMLTTENCSDVIFRMGSEKHEVRAHRYVLASRSCVFHAMFCGPLAEKGRYVYAETADITADNVTGLLYTSRKYAVDGPHKLCLAYLEKSLTEETACIIVEECHAYGEADLEQKAMTVIAEEGPKLPDNDGFNELCSKCFGHFLKSDKLRLKEGDVFTASRSVSWAKEECRRQDLEPSAHHVRQVLGDLRYHIRFPLMSLKFLAKTVGPSGVLSNDERILVMDGISCQDIDVSPFISTPRLGARDPVIVNRFSKGMIASGWGYRTAVPDAISFSVSGDLEFLGFQLYGPSQSKSDTYALTAKVYDCHNEEIPGVSLPCKSYTLLGEEVTNDIFFSNPVNVVAGCKYTLFVIIEGITSYCGKKGQSSIEIQENTFLFYDSAMSGNGTNVDGGQFPGLMFR